MVEIEQASAPVAWRNRIVGYAEVPPRELLANPKNYRLHPTGQRAAVEGMLDELGWVGVAVVNRTTGLMVDGHLRVELALAEDAPSVPVVYVELSEAEEALALAALDQTTGMAATDRAKLEALLDEVRVDTGPLAELLQDIAERSNIYGWAEPATDAEGAVVDDPSDEWGGMPGFQNEDDFHHFRAITVRFADEAAVEQFERAIGQKLSPATKSIRYPERPQLANRSAQVYETPAAAESTPAAEPAA